MAGTKHGRVISMTTLYSIIEAEEIFQSYLDAYIGTVGDDPTFYSKEMKQDIKMVRDIIAKIKAFRERMEELHGADAS